MSYRRHCFEKQSKIQQQQNQKEIQRSFPELSGSDPLLYATQLHLQSEQQCNIWRNTLTQSRKRRAGGADGLKEPAKGPKQAVMSPGEGVSWALELKETTKTISEFRVGVHIAGGHTASG